MLSNKQNLALRSLPAVNNLLQQPELIELIERTSFNFISDITSKVIDQVRNEILHNPEPVLMKKEEIINRIEEKLNNLLIPHLQPVVNGTGVIIHTNLGRSRLSKDSVLAIQTSAINYSNLEYNLIDGTRGSRYDHVEDLLIQLTGAEAAMVVNNNAAAVILILKEMAKDKEVIVSRGQLVEIGGSFRVSEIMAQSGADLVEVGTTNKTHRFDYEKAITDNTGLLLKVHTSNFKIIGFTKEVCLKTLVEIGIEHDIPVYEDLGSGVLYDLKKHGIGDEPTVQEVVNAGADIVSFSGDKLLGGPQTGIIVGKKKFIDRLKKNQLTRSLRVDKMTLVALEATLRHYLLDEAVEKIPTLRMILMDNDTIEKKSKKLYNGLKPILKDKANIKIIDGLSEVGGGSMPDVKLPSKLISIEPFNIAVHEFEALLRLNSPHIIGRINDNQYLLDVRTIEEAEFPTIKHKISKVLEGRL